jgi:hypothetical protein
MLGFRRTNSVGSESMGFGLRHDAATNSRRWISFSGRAVIFSAKGSAACRDSPPEMLQFQILDGEVHGFRRPGRIAALELESVAPPSIEITLVIRNDRLPEESSRCGSTRITVPIRLLVKVRPGARQKLEAGGLSSR